MNYFNNKEFKQLCQKFTGAHHIKNVELTFKSGQYFMSMKQLIEEDRRGEVAFAVIKDGKLITIRSSEYPEGVFRIPTGGISYGEDIESTVLREVKEELGVEVTITSFEGVIKYRILHRHKSLYFYSYLFVLDYVSGELLVDAIEDEVSEVKLVTLKQLNGVSNYLLTLQGFWNDWGSFRYESTNFAHEKLSFNKRII